MNQKSFSALESILAERVMLWKKTEDGWENPNPANDDDKYYSLFVWRPSVDLNDALACLEKVANGEDWDAVKDKNEGYNCSIYIGPGDSGWQKTLPLAMCLCSLRAAGVDEQTISEALK